MHTYSSRWVASLTPIGPAVLQVEQLRGHWEEAVSRAEHIKAAKEVELRARREGALKQEEDAEARRAEAQAATMEAKMLRLEERAADKADTIEERLAIAEAEMYQQDQFDHVIVSSTREADFERAQNIYQNAKAA